MPQKGRFMPNSLSEVYRRRLAGDERVQTHRRAALSSQVGQRASRRVVKVICIVFALYIFRSLYKYFGSIIEKLGHDRTSEVKVVGKEEMQRSYYGQLVLGKGVSSSLDEQLAKEAKKAVSLEKQRVAQEVASILKLNVDIDRSSIESTDLVVATLRAGTEYIGLPVQDCLLIAGSQSGVVGAERIGLSSIVIRSSSTARAEFHKANAVMDGFGGADLTVSKLLNKRFTDPR